MTWQIINADCREALRTLDAGSVQTCITSPPYFGLRDYGTGSWTDGDPQCDHAGSGRPSDSKQWDGTLDGAGDRPRPQGAAHRGGIPGVCACGALRVDRQIGLETTPDEFVDALVEVFREVRRVLRDDGTVWLNLGDSYAGSWGAQGRSGQMAERSVISARQIEEHPQNPARTGTIRQVGVKNKDLIGIPWMVAFALRADGWYLRQDIIWSKPNPMPESVTDRCTKAHEYVFLLSKSHRYFYDAQAIKEPLSETSSIRLSQDVENQAGSDRAHGGGVKTMKAVGPPVGGAKYGDDDATENRTKSGKHYEQGAVRNKRSVWTVTTKPYGGAHFATFPPDLIEPCILAGAPEGATVLDPFAGSGTTGMVALRHGRSFIGCELNPEYVELARHRIIDDAPLLNQPDEVVPSPTQEQRRATA